MSTGPQLTVKLFGAYRDAVGAESLVRPCPPGLRLGALWAQLCAEWPDLAPLAAARLGAVNLDYADDDHPLAPGDEVAFFPPVSGVSVDVPRDHFHVGEAPLDLEPLIAAVSGPGHGAVAVFLGVVRAEGDVVALDYEAYPAMATRQMAALADALRAAHGPLAVACAHRVGRLDVGVVSLALAVGAPHRREAFAAAADFVDRLKRSVPIWKRDLTLDERSET